MARRRATFELNRQILDSTVSCIHTHKYTQMTLFYGAFDFPRIINSLKINGSKSTSEEKMKDMKHQCRL